MLPFVFVEAVEDLLLGFVADGEVL